GQEVTGMQQPHSWRDLLKEVIENIVERQRIANALGVNPITLVRWADKQARPRLHYRQRLIDAVPAQIRQEFAASLAKEFPEEMQPMFLGIESLAGAAVMEFSKQINQNLKGNSFRPALPSEFEESAMACPLTFEGRIAGCLLVSSTRLNYFTARRQQLVQDYTNLLILALR